MKMLTVQQPWADAIMRERHRKDIENRVWAPPTAAVGERIGIHSGLRVDRSARIDLDSPEPRLRGFVLGTVELTDVHEAGSQACRAHGCRQNPWAHWPYDPSQPLSGSNRPEIRELWHWQVEQPRKFVSPLPAKGMLKLWEAGPSLDYLIATAEIDVPSMADIRFEAEP